MLHIIDIIGWKRENKRLVIIGKLRPQYIGNRFFYGY
jgi:hypothetical protein